MLVDSRRHREPLTDAGRNRIAAAFISQVFDTHGANLCLAISQPQPVKRTLRQDNSVLPLQTPSSWPSATFRIIQLDKIDQPGESRLPPTRILAVAQRLLLCESQELLVMHEPTVAETVRAILEYLRKNPDAQDTRSGIVEWWLPAHQVKPRDATIKKALDQLVQAGLLSEHKGKDAQTSYRVTNPAAKGMENSQYRGPPEQITRLPSLIEQQ
jgi:hypothetical protein